MYVSHPVLNLQDITLYSEHNFFNTSSRSHIRLYRQEKIRNLTKDNALTCPRFIASDSLVCYSEWATTSRTEHIHCTSIWTLWRIMLSEIRLWRPKKLPHKVFNSFPLLVLSGFCATAVWRVLRLRTDWKASCESITVADDKVSS